MLLVSALARRRHVRQAKKHAPGIILSMRSTRRLSLAGWLGGGHDEREQTLNQLLSRWMV